MPEVSGKTKQSDFQDMIKPISNDLIALFSSLEDKTTNEILNKAKKENWDPEKIISSIEGLLK